VTLNWVLVQVERVRQQANVEAVINSVIFSLSLLRGVRTPIGSVGIVITLPTPG
jgi:hypothetical protein